MTPCLHKERLNDQLSILIAYWKRLVSIQLHTLASFKEELMMCQAIRIKLSAKEARLKTSRPSQFILLIQSLTSKFKTIKQLFIMELQRKLSSSLLFLRALSMRNCRIKRLQLRKRVFLTSINRNRWRIVLITCSAPQSQATKTPGRRSLSRLAHSLPRKCVSLKWANFQIQ